jgi:hypothetical protein
MGHLQAAVRPGGAGAGDEEQPVIVGPLKDYAFIHARGSWYAGLIDLRDGAPGRPGRPYRRVH